MATITGTVGNDTLNGTTGADTIDGLGGNDSIRGGNGGDSLIGGTGDDILDGQDGNDILSGGDGNDLLYQSFYNDNYDGGAGNDTLSIAGSGVDAYAYTVNLTTGTGSVGAYTSGTLIETSAGNIPAESLKTGDMVRTVDNGYKEILWIGRRKFDLNDLTSYPGLRPVRIRAGVLGHGLPHRDLIVSQQHRILIESKVTKRMLGEKQVLISAKDMLHLDGVEIVTDIDSVEYIHFLYHQHEMVFAEGAIAETLYTSPQTLRFLPLPARQEVFRVFPELSEMNADSLPCSARAFVQGKRSRKAVERHISNSVGLVSFLDAVA